MTHLKVAWTKGLGLSPIIDDDDDNDDGGGGGGGGSLLKSSLDIRIGFVPNCVFVLSLNQFHLFIKKIIQWNEDVGHADDDDNMWSLKWIVYILLCIYIIYILNLFVTWKLHCGIYLILFETIIWDHIIISCQKRCSSEARWSRWSLNIKWLKNTVMCTQNDGGDVVDDDEDDNDDDYDDDGVHLLQFPLPIGNIWVDIHVVDDDDYNDNGDDNDNNNDNNNDNAHLKQLPLPIGNVVFQVDIFPKRFHIQLKQNTASHPS